MSRVGWAVGALDLLARCPLLWTTALGQLAGIGGPSSAHARARELQEAGLVAGAHLPVAPGRGARLLHLTDAGVGTLAEAEGTTPAELAGRLRLRGGDLRALVPGLPHRLDCYRLLCALALEQPGPARVRDWRVHGQRQHPRPSGRSSLVVRLPARAALAWPGGRGAYLLLPDRGAVPLRAHRAGLAALAAIRRAGAPVPPLLVATTDAARVDAWQLMLEQIGADAGQRIVARVVTWDELPPELAPRERVLPPLRRSCAVAATPAGQTRIVGDPFRDPCRPGGRAEQLGCLALRLAPVDRRLLDELGPHPFTTAPDLAAILGWRGTSLRGRLGHLVGGGVVRFEPRQLAPAGPPVPLPELTRDGLAIAAARLGLTPGEAVRFCGYVAARPGAPPDPRPGRPGHARAELLGCPAHTVAVSHFMAELVRLARQRPTAWDDGLLAWRPAALCRRGRVRPDAYGIYRHAGQPYGFFLELDRSTETDDDYREKFRAYYDYLETGAFERDYEEFPTILVAAHGRRPGQTGYGAERRIAAILRALAAERRHRVPLPVLLTTAELIAEDPSGALGPVWREPGDDERERQAIRRRRWVADPSVRSREGTPW